MKHYLTCHPVMSGLVLMAVIILVAIGMGELIVWVAKGLWGIS